MTHYFFISPEHKERFLWAMLHLEDPMREPERLDPEYASAYYLLASHEQIWLATEKYVSPHGMLLKDFLTEKKHRLPSSYVTLVELAANLFNKEVRVDPRDFAFLDTDNFEVVVTALRLRCTRVWYKDIVEA